MERGDWVELGKTTILDILDREYAATVREFEARASNSVWGKNASHIDPDLLSQARRELLTEGRIQADSASTKGGRTVTTFSPSNQRLISTRISLAAARKRLLTSRHQSWSHSTDRYPGGLIGRAGEEALINALRDLDPYSYVDHGTAKYDGVAIAGGPLDASAFLTTPSVPPISFLVLAEMKNQRQWFYAGEPQLHRFLFKAASLQVAHPDVPILPVFVSSRRHNTAYQLGRELGFYAVRYEAQYVLPMSEVPEESLAEVAVELGFIDLRRSTTPNNRLKRALGQSLPRNAQEVAERWAAVAPSIVPTVARLMAPGRSDDTDALLDKLHEVAARAGSPFDYQPLETTRL